MRGKHRLLHQCMAERFPAFPTKDVPSCDTLTRIWREWFGPGGGCQRHPGTAEMLDDTGPRVVVHRPGQVVALDSTPLPVKLRESVFGEAVSVMLTLALDTHAPADAGGLGRGDGMALPRGPRRHRRGLRRPQGRRSAVLRSRDGHHRPRRSYKNHQIVQAQDEIGCNILPACTLRTTDKFAVERTFGSLKTMLLEHLLGFTGTDFRRPRGGSRGRRGADDRADGALHRDLDRGPFYRPQELVDRL
ncbi:hypothetical protein ACF1BU_11750 [Streptomyces sp. NPDC014724]|uniref:hypothetical protein n=1 Tax=unclassified Streptomyces TaxID=2593676 RepID=UPI0036FFB3A3